MVTCLPKSICDRDYRVKGLPEGEAEVLFDMMTEQGSIVIGGETMRVCKHGMTSGRWTLEVDGLVLAEATKPSPMMNCFEIVALGVTFQLSPRLPLSRTYIITCERKRCGEIRPMHAFTRRAVIECDNFIDSPTQLFAFWLIGLMWRRNESVAVGYSS